jgi:hypothetical protein
LDVLDTVHDSICKVSDAESLSQPEEWIQDFITVFVASEVCTRKFATGKQRQLLVVDVIDEHSEA